MNRRQFMANAAAVAVAVAAAPLAVADACACGGLLGRDLKWCDYCRDQFAGEPWPKEAYDFNRIPTTGREINARQAELSEIRITSLWPGPRVRFIKPDEADKFGVIAFDAVHS